MSTKTVWVYDQEESWLEFIDMPMYGSGTKVEVPEELLERYGRLHDECRDAEVELYHYYKAAKLKQSSTEHEQGKSEDK